MHHEVFNEKKVQVRKKLILDLQVRRALKLKVRRKNLKKMFAPWREKVRPGLI